MPLFPTLLLIVNCIRYSVIKRYSVIVLYKMHIVHWYNYLAAIFSVGFLLRGLQSWKLRKTKDLKWCLQEISTEVLFLTGWTATLIYQTFCSNANVDRANISGNNMVSIAETFLALGVFMAYFR